MKTVLTLAACLVVFSSVAGANAIINIDPAGYDFGEVAIGESASAVFTVYSDGDTALAINDVYFMAAGSPDISITSFLFPPIYMSAGAKSQIEITFAPSAGGLASAVLVLESNDTTMPVLEVELTGSAPSEEQTPEEQIEMIVDFTEQAVVDGTLEGDGPGRSAGNRLGALQNMLDQAQKLIDQGRFDEAVTQLESIYKKTDGMDKPGDFVTGPAAAELAEMILDLLDALEGM